MAKPHQTYVREEYVVIPPRHPISVDNHLEVMAARIIDVGEDGAILAGLNGPPMQPQLVGLEAGQAIYMGLGLLVGALGSALVAGLAFRSYGKRKSAVMPAVISGVGALAFGSLIMGLAHLSDDRRVSQMTAGMLLR